MKKRYFVALVLSILIFVSVSPNAVLADKDLSISPVYQKTPVWCWVAVGEMVFEYYNVPNVNPAGIYQCGIIGTLAGLSSPCNRDCRYCTVPAGSIQNIAKMIREYPQIISQGTGQSVPQLQATLTYSSLSKSQVKEEIDNDRPIITGITPSGFPSQSGEPMHVALIVGYEESSNGRVLLTVNDPFPYDLAMFRAQNPFVRAGGQNNGNGSYVIDHDAFSRNLAWGSTIYGIKPISRVGTRTTGNPRTSNDREQRIQECMAERPAACIEVCMESFGHSYEVCQYRMCRPDDPLNIRTWRRKCERQVSRQ